MIGPLPAQTLLSIFEAVRTPLVIAEIPTPPLDLSHSTTNRGLIKHIR
jgi:hypothetical protein